MDVDAEFRKLKQQCNDLAHASTQPKPQLLHQLQAWLDTLERLQAEDLSRERRQLVHDARKGLMRAQIEAPELSAQALQDRLVTAMGSLHAHPEDQTTAPAESQ